MRRGVVRLSPMFLRPHHGACLHISPFRIGVQWALSGGEFRHFSGSCQTQGGALPPRCTQPAHGGRAGAHRGPAIGRQVCHGCGGVAARDGNRTRQERGDTLHTRFEVEAGHQHRKPRHRQRSIGVALRIGTVMCVGRKHARPTCDACGCLRCGTRRRTRAGSRMPELRSKPRRVVGSRARKV